MTEKEIEASELFSDCIRPFSSQNIAPLLKRDLLFEEYEEGLTLTTKPDDLKFKKDFPNAWWMLNILAKEFMEEYNRLNHLGIEWLARDRDGFFQFVRDKMTIRITEEMESTFPGLNVWLINSLSSERYESADSKGLRMLLLPDQVLFDSMHMISFSPAQRFQLCEKNVHAIRKMLNMTSAACLILCRVEEKYQTFALAKDENASDEICRQFPYITFDSYMEWSLCLPVAVDCGSPIHLRSCRQKYLFPFLDDTYADRVHAEQIADSRKWKHQKRLLNATCKLISFCRNNPSALKHGAVLIVAHTNDADRLSKTLCNDYQRGFFLENSIPFPKKNDEARALLERFGSVDGAMIFDEHCRCHAFGVILNSPLCCRSDLSRGSRFNSTASFAESNADTCNGIFGIVASEDGMIDLLPSIL